MAAKEFLANALLQNAAGSWEDKCIAQLQDAAPSGWISGLVDFHGVHIDSLSNASWGIDMHTCYEYCGSRQIPYAFSFQTFASTMTNYFLAWLALTAQLPFETGDPWNNALSFCLAVGSPTLVTYSLSLTILNRFWVRQKFSELRKKAKHISVKDKHDKFEGRLVSVQLLLQEAQQVPLRASQEKGWLSSLIVSPENSRWWETLQEWLTNSRRGVTPSLVAQMALAMIAYLFTVIASFNADLGDPTTAEQIASGSLWIWLIPVILGWIVVGTQRSHDSIEDVLQRRPAYRAKESPLAVGEPIYEREEQKGLLERAGLTPQPYETSTAKGRYDVPSFKRLKVKGWLGNSVAGDEALKGPIFNYARVFTWWQVANVVHGALDQTIENVRDGRACIEGPNQARRGSWNNDDGHRNLVGDCHATARYCGLHNARAILAYPEWHRVPAGLFWRMVQASCVALFVQWGTTGSSILIAYSTPTVGLGCRSGSYLIYGALATLAWFFLVLSMLLSHEVMLRYQNVQVENPSIDFRHSDDPNDPDVYHRTLGHNMLCGLAVLLRCLGKIMAVANAFWLIVSSLLEFVGGYDNCWCKGDYASKGSAGWVVLFKSASQLKAAAQLPWSGGLVTTTLVCVFAVTFFSVFSWNAKGD